MKKLQYYRYNNFSCGICQVYGFGYSLNPDVLEDLKGLDFKRKNIRNGFGHLIQEVWPCAMYQASITGRQRRIYHKYLIEAGFVQVGEGYRNPNSGNTIYLYVKQAKPVKKPRKKSIVVTPLADGGLVFSKGGSA